MLAPAPSAAFQFSDFQSTENLRLNGSTRVVRQKVLLLTPSQPDRAGSVFTRGGVFINRFTTRFAFRIARRGGPFPDCDDQVGGEGLVFVIQGNRPTALGASGAGIGYEGITDSVGIEFDTHCDPSRNDPNSNHVALITDGSTAHVGLPVVPIRQRFDTGRMRYVWIDYDGVTLEVRISPIDARPDRPRLRRVIDIPAIVGGDICCVGFTSATSQNVGAHELISWEYLEQDDDDDDDSRLASGALSRKLGTGTDAGSLLPEDRRTPRLVCRNRVIVN